MSLKKNLFVALIAGSALALTANDSFAFFGRHGSCGSGGGSWGSRGSSGSWGGGSYGGSFGSYGGGSWGSSGGCGSCGSYGGGVAYSYGDGGYASSRVVYNTYASSRPSTTVVAAAPSVKTRLTIHVPAEAKITLAGIETKQSGEVRQFATTRLASGQNWDGYKVVAEIERNGQKLSEERTIKLTGGVAQELTINFDSTKIAQK